MFNTILVQNLKKNKSVEFLKDHETVYTDKIVEVLSYLWKQTKV